MIIDAAQCEREEASSPPHKVEEAWASVVCFMKQQVPLHLSGGDPGSAGLGEISSRGSCSPGEGEWICPTDSREALSEFKATEGHGQTV